MLKTLTATLELANAIPSDYVVCSEAAHRGWLILTTDIRKAFLQGVTYEALSGLTGESIREVNFHLPGNCVPILKQVPGSEDFNEHTEVLHCGKPGTGLVDAPRAFSFKLSQLTKNKCRMMPSPFDGELVLKFELGTLICLMVKHVDDLKLTGKLLIIAAPPYSHNHVWSISSALSVRHSGM